MLRINLILLDDFPSIIQVATAIIKKCMELANALKYGENISGRGNRGDNNNRAIITIKNKFMFLSTFNYNHLPRLTSGQIIL